MQMDSKTPFEERLKIAQERLNASKQNMSNGVTSDQFKDVIPVLESTYTPSETDKQLDIILNTLSIIDAYNKWCGKSNPNPQGKVESIQISCPIPGHLDKNPSAWINTDKNVWFCGRCDIGGDHYDIAAYHFGYPVPGYKDGSNFPKLRQEMAESLGYTVTKYAGGTYLQEPTETQTEEPIEHATIEHLDLAKVLQIFESDDDEVLGPELPFMNWKPLVEPNTFLSSWMESTEIDDIPDEYYFWNGMLALGFAVGRDTYLFDKRIVYGNLFLCVVGPTGSGKSQAEEHLYDLLRAALPFDSKDPCNDGVEIISSPASGEAIIWALCREMTDPSTGKFIGNYPVKGLLDFSELSELTQRSGRQGNTLKPTLIKTYDCPTEISTRSRTSGTIKAVMPFASLLTTTQVKSIGNLLFSEDIGAGFVNRFLFISGKPKQRIPIGGIKISTESSVIPLQKIKIWGKKIEQVGWSPEAKKLYEEIYFDVLEPAKTKSEVLSRLDLLAKKLIFLFSVNEMHSLVQVSSVEKFNSMLEYILNCYGVTENQIGNTLAWELRCDIERHIKRHTKKKGSITQRGLNDLLRHKKYPTSLVKRTIEELVFLNLIEATRTSGAGRPTIKYSSMDS